MFPLDEFLKYVSTVFFIMRGALDIIQQVATFVPSGRFVGIILHVTIKGLVNVSLIIHCLVWTRHFKSID